jgi:hypothetical protein
METRADRGELPASGKVLDRYKVIVERYRDEISVKKFSHNTEIYTLNAFLRQRIADSPLAQVSAANFFSYRDERLKLVKPGTVNRELGIIKHAFDIAMREWDIPDWAAFLADGMQREDDLPAIRASERTGRPLGSPVFIEQLEHRLARPRQKPGRKPRIDEEAK